MNCIIASTSTVYGSSYLEYLRPVLKKHFLNVDEVLFIPYARPSGLSYDKYTKKAQSGLGFLGKTVKGLHEFKHPQQAIRDAKSIFVGGGNTFLLLKTLKDQNLMPLLKEKIRSGTPYFGTSAGSNICGLTMQTTNDMPIVMPHDFDTLGILPFNINAHYIEPSKNSKHKGETRRIRIKEFQVFNNINVIGLKEGSWLEVRAKNIQLKGEFDAIWFEPSKDPEIISSNSYLL